MFVFYQHVGIDLFFPNHVRLNSFDYKRVQIHKQKIENLTTQRFKRNDIFGNVMFVYDTRNGTLAALVNFAVSLFFFYIFLCLSEQNRFEKTIKRLAYTQ